MSCDPFKKRLSAYLDDEVPLPERRAIEDHLAGCAACRTLREEFARATQVLAGSPEPHWSPNSTDALIGNLRAKIARERPVSRSLSVPPPPPVYNWRALALPLAAVFLVVAIPGLWIGTRRPEPVPEARASAQLAVAPKPVERKLELARAKSAADAPAPVVAAPAAIAPREAQLAQAPRQDAARANMAGADKPMLAAATAPAKDTGAMGRLAETRALANLSAPVSGLRSPVSDLKPQASGLKPQASGLLPGLDLELAELERRLQAVELEISSFTTAARQQAQRESNQVASRRFATWR